MFILLNSGGFPFYLVPLGVVLFSQVSVLYGACDHKASTQPCYRAYTRASRVLLSERSEQSVDRRVSLCLHSQQWCWCGSWKIRSSCHSGKNFRRQAKRKMEVENRLTRKSGLKSKITEQAKEARKWLPPYVLLRWPGAVRKPTPGAILKWK